MSLIRELELTGQLSGPLKIDAAGERNPYRSHRPIRDFEVDGGNDCFFNNNYYSVVRLGQE